MEENLIIKTSKLIWHIDLVPSIRNWSFIQCSTSKLTRWRREYSATFWLLFHSIIRRCVLYFYFLINHIHGGTHTHTHVRAFTQHKHTLATKKKKRQAIFWLSSPIFFVKKKITDWEKICFSLWLNIPNKSLHTAAEWKRNMDGFFSHTIIFTFPRFCIFTSAKVFSHFHCEKGPLTMDYKV